MLAVLIRDWNLLRFPELCQGNRVRGGAGSFLRSMRRGQSHFRGGNEGSLGKNALCAAKIGTVPLLTVTWQAALSLRVSRN